MQTTRLRQCARGVENDNSAGEQRESKRPVVHRLVAGFSHPGRATFYPDALPRSPIYRGDRSPAVNRALRVQWSVTWESLDCASQVTAADGLAIVVLGSIVG